MLLENELNGFHHVTLVVISVLLAIVASYTAINLVSRINGSSLKNQILWLIASTVMGGGIWGMHFIGMIAYDIGITVSYDFGLVLLSFLLAVKSSIISFHLMKYYQQKRSYVFLSGFILGMGIFAMHYISMESMEMHAEISYDPSKLTFAFVVAVIASWIAFWFFSKLKDNKIFVKLWIKIFGATFLGVAVSSMHYIGMSAANITVDSHPHIVTVGETNSPFILASLISAFIFLVLMVILIRSYLDEKASQKLKESEKRYRSIVELAPYGIVIHQLGTIIYVNPAGVREVGASNMDELVGRHILEFVHPDYHEIVQERMKTVYHDNRKIEFIEEKMIRLDGQMFDVEIMGIPIEMNGERHAQLIFRNISDRKKAEKLVYQLAYHDPLTGLPNRRLFLDRLNQILEASQGASNLAVMFIDMDGFKQVNDTYGHDVGDELLKAIATHLTSCVREVDLVARLAGDEFTILLPSISQQEIIKIAEHIIESFATPMNIKEIAVKVTPSIGISFNTEKLDAEGLLKRADMAMYQAKKQGKNCYKIVE